MSNIDIAKEERNANLTNKQIIRDHLIIFSLVRRIFLIFT